MVHLDNRAIRPNLIAKIVTIVAFCMFLILSLIAALHVNSAELIDSWTRRGMERIVITHIVATTNTQNRLYAASRDSIGVRMSNDSGQTWQPDDAGLSNKNIESLVVCGVNTLFAGSWGEGVYRQQAGGAWESKNKNLSRLFISALACSANNMILAGTIDQGIFRSLNNGEDWEAVNNGLTQSQINTLSANAGGIFAGTPKGIFHSTDNGASWQAGGLANRAVYNLLATNSDLWAATDQGVFHTTLTSSIQWQSVGSLSQTVFALAYDSAGRLYAGTSTAKVWRYENNNWLSFSIGLQPAKILTLANTQNNLDMLFAGTEDGIWFNQIQAQVAPTPTFTNTPTPTPTNTPQPGIGYFHIRGEPTGVIAPGEKLTYTVDYRAIDFPKANFALDNVVITTAVPAQVDLIPGTIRGINGTQVLSTTNGVSSGSIITWILQKPVHNGEAGSVAYTVRRAMLAVVPANGMSLTKQGPTAARAGQIILYKLIAKNITTTVASNIVITDRLPAGAEYILSSDGGVLTDGVVRWQLGQLSSEQSTTVTLAVKANQTIINNDYRVHAEKGLFAQGDVAVKTIINGTSELPAVSNTITNNGAWITWQYDGKSPAQPLTTGPTYNPLITLYFPWLQNQ